MNEEEKIKKSNPWVDKDIQVREDEVLKEENLKTSTTVFSKLKRYFTTQKSQMLCTCMICGSQNYGFEKHKKHVCKKPSERSLVEKKRVRECKKWVHELKDSGALK
jgi:hypothetical protein